MGKELYFFLMKVSMTDVSTMIFLMATGLNYKLDDLFETMVIFMKEIALILKPQVKEF
jgi:hypothetical protein